jgi:hypothetical protein
VELQPHQRRAWVEEPLDGTCIAGSDRNSACRQGKRIPVPMHEGETPRQAGDAVLRFRGKPHRPPPDFVVGILHHAGSEHVRKHLCAKTNAKNRHTGTGRLFYACLFGCQPWVVPVLVHIHGSPEHHQTGDVRRVRALPTLPPLDHPQFKSPCPETRLQCPGPLPHGMLENQNLPACAHLRAESPMIPRRILQSPQAPGKGTATPGACASAPRSAGKPADASLCPP